MTNNYETLLKDFRGDQKLDVLVSANGKECYEFHLKIHSKRNTKIPYFVLE